MNKAKQQAIKDIKDDLKQTSRAFITFIEELNPVMDTLVEEQIEEQKQIKRSYFFSMWSTKKVLTPINKEK